MEPTPVVYILRCADGTFYTLCAPVKTTGHCTSLGGTILSGQSCVPTNDCFLPASPSGAFLQRSNADDTVTSTLAGWSGLQAPR